MALIIVLPYFSPALPSYYLKRDGENNNILKKLHVLYKVCLKTYFNIKERLRRECMKFCKHGRTTVWIPRSITKRLPLETDAHI